MLALRGGVVGNGGGVGESWMSAVEVIRVVVEDANTGPVAGSVRSHAGPSSRGRVADDGARDVDLAHGNAPPATVCGNHINDPLDGYRHRRALKVKAGLFATLSLLTHHLAGSIPSGRPL